MTTPAKDKNIKKHPCNVYIDDVICANCKLCDIEERNNKINHGRTNIS